MKVAIGYFLTNFNYPFFKYTDKPKLIPNIANWCESVNKNGMSAIVFLDDEQYMSHPITKRYESIKFEYVDSSGGINPMDYRWVLLNRFLESRTDIEAFIMTDVGDAMFLKNPFDFILGKAGCIYIGDEETQVSNGWISQRVSLINNEECSRLYEAIKDNKLLNCGILGGYTKDVQPLVKAVSDRLLLYKCTSDTVDMVVFNEIIYTQPELWRVYHGFPLNTEFWKWDWNSEHCYIQHK